jgi:thiol:disulfide interchange protein DsbC
LGLSGKSGLLLFVLVLCAVFGAAKLFVENAETVSADRAENSSQVATNVISELEATEISSAESKLLSNLLAARSDLEYTIVGASAVPGIYEVQVKNGPLLFVHESGEYLFQGDLLQVKANEIISTLELRQKEQRRKLFAERSTEDMIVFKPETETKAIMNVFTDVDCGYCRKFHREVPELNAMGIEVRYLAFPRAGIPSGSYNKIAKAWCADDKQDTLTKVKNGQSVNVEVCDNNPVADHYSFGNSIGVTGTPAIVLMDGTLIPGYQPAENYAKLMGISVE